MYLRGVIANKAVELVVKTYRIQGMPWLVDEWETISRYVTEELLQFRNAADSPPIQLPKRVTWFWYIYSHPCIFVHNAQPWK